MNRTLDAKKAEPNKLVVAETIIIVSIGFLSAIVGSIVFVLTEDPKWRYQFSWTAGNAIVHQLPVLATLYWVLSSRGAKMDAIGLMFRWRVIPISIILYAICGALNSLMINFVPSTWNTQETNAIFEASRRTVTEVPTALSVSFILLLAIKEDLLARAYLIEQCKRLGLSPWIGVLAGALLLAVCHLYQGVTFAAAKLPASILLSSYYAWKRDITSVILAHIIYNTVLLSVDV